MRVRREFLQRLAWDFDVPNDVNTERIGDSSESEIKPIGSVSIVGDGDGQRYLVCLLYTSDAADD